MPSLHKHVELYEVLGIEPTASASDILRAYRICALKAHPDKNPNDPEATGKFQLLQYAYNVLKDPKKRRHYDLTGDTSDDSISFETYYERFKDTFIPVTADLIDEFAQKYFGSSDEEEDILSYLERFSGDLKFFFECVPLSEPSQCLRYLEIIQKLIDEKKLQSSRKLEQSRARFLEIGAKWQRNAEKEKTRANKERARGAKPRSGSTKRQKPNKEDEESDLLLAIQLNQQRRTSRMSSIIEKYAQESQLSPQPEPSEDDFQAARSRLNERKEFPKRKTKGAR